jgi:hypothetical protein
VPEQTKKRICARPGCTVEVKPGVLACRPHWASLSPRLRDRLVFAWEQRKEHPDIPELVNIHRALLLEALREWGIPPEVIAAEMKARAPKTIDINCPFCGARQPLHRVGCQRLN